MENNWQEISDSEVWEKALTRFPQASFLQSYAFGSFQEKLGNRVWRLSDGSGCCQVIKMVSKTGSFLYIPGGPLLGDWEAQIPALKEVLFDLAHSERASFVRFDPRTFDETQKNLLKSVGFKQAPFYTQPQCTLTLDLTKSVEEIRSGLSSSTRYNIGWVARQGVVVKVSETTSDVEIFLKLLKETAARQKFRLTNLDYYRAQFLEFAQQGQAKLYLTFGAGEFKDQVLSAAVVIYWGSTATYLHAASSSRAPKLRAPYLMQWQIITDAKNAGLKNYDFWGVAASSSPKDPWAGVTEFKKGFGGERITYRPPYDMVVSNSYYWQRVAENLRKIIRKFR